MTSQQPAERAAGTEWAPRLTAPNIVLLCLLMLIIGWEARGIKERNRCDELLDARLVQAIVYGVCSGWLTFNGDAVASAAEVEPTASPPSPARPGSDGHSSPQHPVTPVASAQDAWHPNT